MKKWITATLAAVCTVSACVGFAACSQKEMQLDKEYVYSSISFKNAADITLSDVSSFIPFGYTDKISNISDFEKFHAWSASAQRPILRKMPHQKEKEVAKMFFFSCNSNCNTGCGSIWQILSQICGIGC